MVNVTEADAKTLREMRLSHIAMVFQAFGLLPWRTVRENVGLGLELGGMPAPERLARWTINWPSWGFRIGPIARWVTCLAGCNNASGWRGPLLLTRRSC